MGKTEDVEETQNKILDIWGTADDKTALKMFAEWFEWDAMNDWFQESIKTYDDYETLENFYKTHNTWIKRK